MSWAIGKWIIDEITTKCENMTNSIKERLTDEVGKITNKRYKKLRSAYFYIRPLGEYSLFSATGRGEIKKILISIESNTTYELKIMVDGVEYFTLPINYSYIIHPSGLTGYFTLDETISFTKNFKIIVRQTNGNDSANVMGHIVYALEEDRIK